MASTTIQLTDGTTVTISAAMGRALAGALEFAEKHPTESHQILDEVGENRRSVGWPTKHALVKRGLAYYKDLTHYTVTILTEDGIRAAKQLRDAVDITHVRRALRRAPDGYGYVSTDGRFRVRPAYEPSIRGGSVSRPSYWNVTDTENGSTSTHPTLTDARLSIQSR